MATTNNFNLFITDDGQTTFQDFREELCGESDSNMTKIDAALAAIEDKIPRIFFGVSSSAPTDSRRVVLVSQADWDRLEDGLQNGDQLVCRFVYRDEVALRSLSLTDGTNTSSTINVYTNYNEISTSAPVLEPLMWKAGSVIHFSYNAGKNCWIALNTIAATQTYYGVTKLSNATNSASENCAATSKAVKSAYDALAAIITDLDSLPDDVEDLADYVADLDQGLSQLHLAFYDWLEEFECYGGLKLLDILQKANTKTFTLNGVSYEFIDGMTWRDYISFQQGAYNLARLSLMNDADNSVVYEGAGDREYVALSGNGNVSAGDRIQSGVAYVLT